MARIFEVWHTNPETSKDERYAVCEFLDKDEDVDPCYGLEKLTMTVGDLNALLNGKKLYAQINAGEYAIEISYAGNDE